MDGSRNTSREISVCKSFIKNTVKTLTQNSLYFKTVAQDIFKLGLVFFYLFTEGKSVMQITTKFFKSNPKHEARIDLKPLDLLRSDTECILFIDLIKSMVQEEPNYRVTSESLIEHALFKENEERLQIVQELAEKCFDKDQCIYEYLVEIMNQNEKHMKGSLVEDSAEWKKLFAKTAKFPDLKLHIKVCSNLVKLISKQVI